MDSYNDGQMMSHLIYFSYHCACCQDCELLFFYIKTVCIHYKLAIWNTSIYRQHTLWKWLIPEYLCLFFCWKNWSKKHWDLNLKKNENSSIIFTLVSFTATALNSNDSQFIVCNSKTAVYHSTGSLSISNDIRRLDPWSCFFGHRKITNVISVWKCGKQDRAYSEW